VSPVDSKAAAEDERTEGATLQAGEGQQRLRAVAERGNRTRTEMRQKAAYLTGAATKLR